MRHKLSLRQYKRLLGIYGEEQLATVFSELEALSLQAGLSESTRSFLHGLPQFFEQVDEAYDQADRDLALGKRSLELSSDELMDANRALRQESEMRSQVMLTLRQAANEALAQVGQHLADEESLESLSTLLAGLVSDILSTRSELQTALAAIKNQQFALDQHAIVSITDAAGDLIYANEQFCQITQYTWEELKGKNHRFINSDLHSKDFFSQLWNTITLGEVWHGEIRNRKRDGSLFWTNATIVPFLDADQIPYQYISIRTDITEERLLKDEIEASKRLLQNVMDTLGEGVYTLDAAGRCTFINPEAEKIIGWSLEEARGHIFHDLVHGSSRDGQQVQHEQCPINMTVASGQVYRSEDEYFQHKNGNFYPVSIVASPIFENGAIVGSVAAFQDVTARHAADAALRASETKQRMMLDNAADAVFVADKTERWIYVNDLAVQMLGYTREEMIGMSVYDLLPPDQREESRENFAHRLMRDKLVRQEIRLLKKNGVQVPVEMNAALLPDGSIYGSCRDITSRKEFEAELIKAKLGAEAANHAKSDFLATMSHEIRTPMNGIIGMTELTLDSDLNPHQRDHLELVKTASYSLLAIINDILDFSKIESGKITLERIEFSLREMVASTLKALALRAEQKNIELVYEVDSRLPENIIGDPGKLRQVLTNLIGNAIKFSERGSISLIVKLVERQHKDLRIYFSVLDHGIGIAADKLEYVFEPFSQADASTTRKYGGTGLGLSISSRLVSSMDGKLEVLSELGSGSQFYFSGVFQMGAPNLTLASTSNLRGISALLVDDVALNREFLGETLRLWNIQVETADSASTGVEKIALAYQREQPFDLLLLDTSLPEMNGEAVLEQLHLDGKLSTTKVILLTGPGSLPNVASKKAVFAMIRKPVSLSELHHAIERLINTPHEILGLMDAVQTPQDQVMGASLRILIAEDNLINQKLAVSLLERWGHRTMVATNGLEAVNIFKENRFDVILMDMQMPEMSGIEATQKIRELETLAQRIPIVAMTANAMQGDRERCFEVGMDYYLSKPIKADALRNLLTQIFLTRYVEVNANDTMNFTASAILTKNNGVPRVNGFNFESALEASDAEIVPIIGPMFLEAYHQQLRDIETAILNEDSEHLCRSAHTMKGLLGNFGAQPLVELARSLELKGRNQDNARVGVLFKDLQAQLPQLISALKKHLVHKL